MFKFSAIAVLIVLSFPAHAACSQENLTGLWRFIFDTGVIRGDGKQSRTMSCTLNVRNNGAIVSRGCQTVDGTGDGGAFHIQSPNRRLKMNVNRCEVVIGGQIVFANDFSLAFGNVSYHFNGASLSISQNKQMMLGWVSVYGAPVFSVTALKLATP